MVMNWRMQPEITRYMNTDPVLDIEKQKAWFLRQQQDDTSYQWIIEADGEPVGVTSITGIDRRNGTCTRGIYVAVRQKRSFKMIQEIYASQYDFVFEQLGLNKIEIEVFEENKNVVLLAQMCGFIKEGVLREHICKNGRYYNIVQLGITKADWEAKKGKWNYQPIEIRTQ